MLGVRNVVSLPLLIDTAAEMYFWVVWCFSINIGNALKAKLHTDIGSECCAQSHHKEEILAPIIQSL